MCFQELRLRYGSLEAVQRMHQRNKPHTLCMIISVQRPVTVRSSFVCHVHRSEYDDGSGTIDPKALEELLLRLDPPLGLGPYADSKDVLR